MMHKTNSSNDLALKQDCQAAVRALELEAYSLLLTAFRARGIINEDRLDALEHLRDILKLSINRHNSELRRICDDPDLANLAISVNGTDQWANGDFTIGRFFDQSNSSFSPNFNNNQPDEYRNAFKSLADDLQSLTSRHNKKLTVNKQQQQQKQLNKKRKSESEYKPQLKHQQRNDQQQQLPTCSKTADKVNKIVDSVANSAAVGPPGQQQQRPTVNLSHVTNQFFLQPQQQQQPPLQIGAPPIGQMIAATSLPPPTVGQNPTAGAATVLVACGQRYFVMPSFFLQNSAATSPPMVTTTSGQGQSIMLSPSTSSSRDPLGQPLFRAPSSF